MVAGAEGVADDGVLADADQAAGLADADAFLEVGQDRGGLVVGQAAAEERGALALGEAGLAGLAVQQAALVAAVAAADGEVAAAAPAVVGAVGVLAAEATQVVVHGAVLQGGRAGCRSAAVVIENACRAFNPTGTPPGFAGPELHDDMRHGSLLRFLT